MITRITILALIAMLVVVQPSMVRWAQADTGLQDTAPPELASFSIDLEPLFFNLIQRNRVRGRVQIDLTMELVNSEDFEDIKLRVPQIRSDILTAMTTFARDRIRPDEPLNPDMIVNFLQPVVDGRLGSGRVTLFVRNALITPK